MLQKVLPVNNVINTGMPFIKVSLQAGHEALLNVLLHDSFGLTVQKLF
jgi:hypothetical protein